MTVTQKAARLLFLSVICSALAQADYITGIGWTIPASTAGSTPTLGNTPGAGATAVVTFTANGINFSGDAPGAYNLGGFLNAFGVAGNINYLNGASASTDLDNTEWEFTGSAFFTYDTGFTVVHDDGVNLYVNGSPVLLDGGSSPPESTPFSYLGPTGQFNFDFIYTECCGGSADFQTSLVASAPTTVNPTSAPEPSFKYLVLAGLLVGAVGLRRRAVQ